ncbi:MAG: globin domain-containing protein [Planctomycetota bacterium]
MGPNQTYRLRRSFCELVPRFDAVAERFFDGVANRSPSLGRGIAACRDDARRKLLTAVGLVVTRADRLAELEDALLELGEGHVEYDCSPDEYAVVLEELIAAFREWSGPTWTEQLELDWSDALDTVADLIVRVVRVRQPVVRSIAA